MNRHATRRIFLAIVALAMIASLFLPAAKLYVHSQLGGETAALFPEHTSAWQMAFAPHSGLPADAIPALGLVTYSAVYQVIAAVLLVLSAAAIALGGRKQTIAGLILAALSVPFSGAFVLQLTNLSSSLLFRLLITPQIAIYLPLAGAVVLMLTAVVSLHGSKAEREAEGYKKAPSLLSEKQWRLLCAVLALLSALVMLLPVYSISVPETVTGSPADAAALNRNVSMLEAGLGHDSMLSALKAEGNFQDVITGDIGALEPFSADANNIRGIFLIGQSSSTQTMNIAVIAGLVLLVLAGVLALIPSIDKWFPTVLATLGAIAAGSAILGVMSVGDPDMYTGASRQILHLGLGTVTPWGLCSVMLAAFSAVSGMLCIRTANAPYFVSPIPQNHLLQFVAAVLAVMAIAFTFLPVGTVNFYTPVKTKVTSSVELTGLQAMSLRAPDSMAAPTSGKGKTLYSEEAGEGEGSHLPGSPGPLPADKIIADPRRECAGYEAAHRAEAHAGADLHRAQHAAGRDAEGEIGQDQPEDQADPKAQPQRLHMGAVVVRGGGGLDLRAEILFLRLHGLAAVRRAEPAHADPDAGEETGQILPEGREGVAVGRLGLIVVIHRVGGGGDLTVVQPEGGVLRVGPALCARRFFPARLPSGGQTAQFCFQGGERLLGRLFLKGRGFGGGVLVGRFLHVGGNLVFGVGQRLLTGRRILIREADAEIGLLRFACLGRGSLRYGSGRFGLLALLLHGGHRPGEEAAGLLFHGGAAALRGLMRHRCFALRGSGILLRHGRILRGGIAVKLGQDILHREMGTHRLAQAFGPALLQGTDAGGQLVRPVARSGGDNIRLFLCVRHVRSHSPGGRCPGLGALRLPIVPVFVQNVHPVVSVRGAVAPARGGALRLLIGGDGMAAVMPPHRRIGGDVRLVGVALLPGGLQNVLHRAAVRGVDRLRLLRLGAEILLPVVRLTELNGHGVAGRAAVGAILLQDLPQGDGEGLRLLLIEDLSPLGAVGLQSGILRALHRQILLFADLVFRLHPLFFHFDVLLPLPACQALFPPFVSFSGKTRYRLRCLKISYMVIAAAAEALRELSCPFIGRLTI